MWTKNLKRLLVMLLLLSVALSGFSQSLQDPAQMSDEEILNELSAIMQSLEKDNESLKKSLNQTQEQLETLEENSINRQALLIIQEQKLAEQETSLQNFAKEKAADMFKAAAITGGVCFVAGAVVGLVVFR